jgi:uncharacterized membrane protein (DUF373 family)
MMNKPVVHPEGQSAAPAQMQVDTGEDIDVDAFLPPRGAWEWGANFIHLAEHVVYLAIGAMLVLALLLALAGSGKLLWDGLQDWYGEQPIFDIIDRLLFVLMLVEILHTIHASIRTGTLVCEPFLIVGLIACIRRILVITLETSQITKPDHWADNNIALFHASMLELGVLAVLIIVLVGSIRMTRTAPSRKAKTREG